LYYWSGDAVGREPYWVSRSVGNKVVIGYLLSYYRDEGSTNTLCSLPFAPESCHGHNGDNEAVFLTVYYDPAHSHWILDEGRYFQHGVPEVYARGSNIYPKMSGYPAKAGGYPRVYVSEGKHASYGFRNQCSGVGSMARITVTT
jgi:hypothetical protein